MQLERILTNIFSLSLLFICLCSYLYDHVKLQSFQNNLLQSNNIISLMLMQSNNLQ
jgi:predicted membrane channel-forming protein YqfA (hemolysin III family)